MSRDATAGRLSRAVERRVFAAHTLAAMGFATKPLDASTWSDFEKLAEDHHGVWAGCWCLGFHEEGRNGVHSPAQRRELKEARVAGGRAHAALVYDGPRCVGWCQFGSPAEL